MFTKCPHCHTVMSVALAQLRVARGRVRCGHCVKSFHALDYLGERAEDVAGASQVAMSLQMRASTGDEAHMPGAVPVLNAPGHEAFAHDRRAKDSVEERSDRPQARVRPGTTHATRQSSPELEMPAVLRDDLERRAAARSGSRRTVAWGLVSLVLVVLLGAQYAWFMPNDLAARFPQSRTWLARFCAHTGCALPHTLDPSGVDIVTRDVRIHPDYEGALLVNATLMNALPFPQPFPRIQFILYNVTGETIAGRIFEPAEYLGREVDLSPGMVPKVPVQASLELLAVEQAAVSFEFRFL